MQGTRPIGPHGCCGEGAPGGRLLVFQANQSAALWPEWESVRRRLGRGWHKASVKA